MHIHYSHRRIHLPIPPCMFLINTEERPRDRRTLDEDEVRLDELLDDLALEEAAPEADVEADGIAAAVVNGASAGAEQSVFAFDPAGMKFV